MIKKSLLVVPSRQGQLGNRLTIFANFIAFAEEYGVPIINLGFDEYAQYFEGTAQDALCHYPRCPEFFRIETVNALVQLYKAFLRKVSGYFQEIDFDRDALRNAGGEELNLIATPDVRHNICEFGILLAEGVKDGLYDANLIRCIRPDGVHFDLDEPSFLAKLNEQQLIWLCDGWEFRVNKTLWKHHATICNYLRPLAEHRDRVSATVNAVRSRCDVLVGVHIRHGDYKTFAEGKFYFELPVYIKLMQQVLTQFPDQRVGFLVCSDARQDPGALQQFIYSFGTGHLVEDLHCLAACDFVFGPPSTYSGWASFYGDIPRYNLQHADDTPMVRRALEERRLTLNRVDI